MFKKKTNIRHERDVFFFKRDIRRERDLFEKKCLTWERGIFSKEFLDLILGNCFNSLSVGFLKV